MSDVDHRVDIWAFCALLRAAVGGEPATASPDARTRRNAERTALDVRVSASACDRQPELWAIVRRGLSYDRGLRFQSMRELVRALTVWLLARGVIEDVCGNHLEHPAPCATRPRGVWTSRTMVRSKPAVRRERRHVVYPQAGCVAGG
jgi:hypothetical protein